MVPRAGSGPSHKRVLGGFGLVAAVCRFDDMSFERFDCKPRAIRDICALFALDSGELLVGYVHGGLGLGLRVPRETMNDLGRTLAAAEDDLSQGRAVTFSVAVEGARGRLVPSVKDEAYRIAREALLNGFAHAQAASMAALPSPC
jgi:hypothetical protein